MQDGVVLLALHPQPDEKVTKRAVPGVRQQGTQRHPQQQTLREAGRVVGSVMTGKIKL